MATRRYSVQPDSFKKQQKQLNDLIGSKIADRNMKVSSNNPQENTSGTVTNDKDKEIPKGRYISPEKRQEMMK